MVGKIKHVRQKIHHEAVKLARPSGVSQPPDSGLPLSLEKPLVFGRHTTSPSLAVEHGNSDASKNAKKVRENCLAKYCSHVWSNINYVKSSSFELGLKCAGCLNGEIIVLHITEKYGY